MNDDLQLTISTGRSRKELTWKTERTTWGELADRLSHTKRTSETEAEYAAMSKDERANVKDVGGFVGGEVAGGQRRKENVRSRQLLALDIDYGTPDTWMDYEMMCDWECLMHTTHSHTAVQPRYRMYFPLSRPVMKDEYEAIARKVAEQIDMELFDDTTYQAARLMYWPSTPQDGEFKVWRHQGALVDPDEILSWYKDWHDQSEWPTSSRTHIEIKRQVEQVENPLTKQNIIGDFCRAYDIPSAIDKYLPGVYEPTEKDPRRYTYAKGSTVGGLVLYGAGKGAAASKPPYVLCYSNHSTDPAYLQQCNAFDLVRIHKFPEKDAESGTLAMRNLCISDQLVREQYDLRTAKSAAEDFEESDDELQRLQQDYSEQGNALRLKDEYYNRMRYNPNLGWCIWDGEVWQTNAEEYAMLNVMRLADKWHDEAERALQLAPKPEKGAKKEDWPPEYKAACALYAWAKQCRGRTNQNHTLASAQTLMLLPDANAFDDDPWILNTPDGIIDLKTGECKPHHADYMCTKITTVSPDWNAPHPKWDGFLERITEGDKSLQQYLQEVAGMALVGKVYEEGVVICYGPGGNGKSTLFEIWKSVMGDYALTVRNELVMGSKNGNEVAGQAQLRKMRLVITGELEAGQAMSNSMVKRITSRDDIQANIKYLEPVTFTPTHTLVLHTNHLPNLKTVDDGIRRRLAIVPILARIKPEEKVTDFADELLKTEASAVLAWMIDGAKRFYQNKMKIEKPEAVRKMSEEYMKEADILGLFLAETCDVGGDLQENQAELCRVYSDWMNGNDLKPMGKITFLRVLGERGFKTKRTKKDRLVLGLKMKSEFEEEL